jgi:heme-degrading monooxygenase HmoA
VGAHSKASAVPGFKPDPRRLTEGKEEFRMAEHYASGSWQVTNGKEDEFMARWTEFLQWTRETQPGLMSARLTRRADDPSHFLSFSQWKDEASLATWKQSQDFQQRLGACRSLCTEFDSGDYDSVVEF